MEYEKLTREEDYLQSRADEYVWRCARELGVSRRRFFQILAAGGAAAALSGRFEPKGLGSSGPDASNQAHAQGAVQ